MFTQRGGKLYLADTCVRPHGFQLPEEVLVRIRVNGLLHLQAENWLAGSNLSWDMRRSLKTLGVSVGRAGPPECLSSQAYLEDVPMNAKATQSQKLWSSLPLCARYFVVNIEAEAALLSVGDVTCRRFFWWAVGTLCNGESELLGSWWDSESGPIGWDAIHADLSARGVTHIDQVFGLPNVAETKGSRRFEDSDELREAGLVGPMSARRRLIVVKAADRTQRAQKSLSRALSRHGSFASAGAANDFVARQLARLDGQFISRPDAPRQRLPIYRGPSAAQAVAR